MKLDKMPRSSTITAILINLFLVLTNFAIDAVDWKPCTGPPVVTVVYSAGQSKCPFRCVDELLDDYYCEEDGISPVTCVNDEDCPFGTCSVTDCKSLTCTQNTSDPVSYHKFKICRGSLQDNNASSSELISSSVCCDGTHIAYIVGAAVLLTVIVLAIFLVIRRKRRAIYRRPGSGNTDLAIVYSERDQDEGEAY